MGNLYTIAIILHAASATAAFIVGIILLFQSGQLQRQLATTVLVLLSLMEIFMIAAILSHVSTLPAILQGTFTGLAVLGLYLVWRAVQTVLVLRNPDGDQLAVISHIGFILISLFDGFAIVSSIDLHAPAWLVAIIAVAAVILGIYGIEQRKKTLLRTASKTQPNVT
jgi:hypothetical protein